MTSETKKLLVSKLLTAAITFVTSCLGALSVAVSGIAG